MRIVRAVQGTLVTSFVAATAVLIAPYSVAQAAETGGIGGRPAHPRKDEPRSDSIFIQTVDKGQTVKDAIKVVNGTSEKRTIEVYPVDAGRTNTGSIACKQKADDRTQAGSWIALEKQEVTIEPKQSEVVNFTVAVPNEGVSVGEHNACIAVQPKDDEGEIKGNLRIRTRAAVRVALTIPGDLKRSVDISKFAVENVEPSEGVGPQQRYGLELKNSGNVSADTRVLVTLKTLFGGEVHRNEGEYPVYPDGNLSLNLMNQQLPWYGGWYWANASVTYDSDPTTFGLDQNSNLVTKDANKQLVFIMPSPTALIIAGAIILALFVLLVVLRRRRRATVKAQKTWATYTVKSGDTVQSIADDRGVSWKLLAKVNKLQAPYSLRTGKVIRVPKGKR